MLQPLRDPLKLFTDQVVVPASYIVFKDGDRIYVKNGKTGQIEYSSYDGSDAIQYAIDRASARGGGKVFIDAGVYTISNSLVLKEGVEIEGVFPLRALVEAIGKAPDSSSAVLVGGTILQAADPNLTCFTGQNLRGVYLHKLGIKGFSRAIDVGATNVLGMAFSRIENLYMDNAGDVAIRLVNVQHLRVSHIKAIIPRSNARFMHIINDHSWDGGNSVIDDLYVIGGAGTDGVILLEAVNKVLNLIEIVRPQVNMWGSNGAGSGIRLRGVGGTGVCSRINLYGVDIEGNPQAAVKLEGHTDQNYIEIAYTDATYGVMDAPVDTRNPTFNFAVSPGKNRHKLTDSKNLILLTQPAYRPVEGNCPVIDTGWMSGEGSRLRVWYYGKMGLSISYDGKVFAYDRNSGVATISAGDTRVTVSHGLPSKPGKVLVTPLGQPPGKLWVENIASTSFDIVTDTAPSTNLDVAWYAEV